MAALWQAVGSIVGSTGSPSVAWPAHAADDIAILGVKTAAAEPATVPSGWTEISIADLGGPAGMWCWRRALSSAESDVVVADAGDHTIGLIATFRGCLASGNPIDTFAVGTKSTSTSGSIAGVNAVEGGNDILYWTVRGGDIATAHFSGEANANLTSLTERFDAGATAGGGGGMGIWTGNLAAPGATGTLTYTLATSRGETFICLSFLTVAAGGGGRLVGPSALLQSGLAGQSFLAG